MLRIASISLFFLILLCSTNALAESPVCSTEYSEEEAEVVSILEFGDLSYEEIMFIMMWNHKIFSKYMAALQIVGYAALIAAIILNPPVGIAAALLAVLGLNIGAVSFGMGLGILFGVW